MNAADLSAPAASDPVLLVDGDGKRARQLCEWLGGNGVSVPVHVPAVVGAIREICSRSYGLVLTDVNLQRGRDGLKLLRLILLEGAVAKPPAVAVLTAETDPAVVQQCLRAGVVDYILYPCEPKTLVARVNRAMGGHQNLGERLVKASVPYLGPAARVFLQTQVRAHLPGVTLDNLDRANLPALLRGVRSAGVRVVGARAEDLVKHLEATFRVDRGWTPAA